MEAKQTPLIELLERVPQDARVVVEHDQFSSSSHPVGRLCHEAAAALRAALTQEQAVPVVGIIESKIKVDSHQTIDEAMQQPRAMAQAYENGYKAGAAAERKRIIQFLTEMQRQVGDGHSHYGVAAMRIRERV